MCPEFFRWYVAQNGINPTHVQPNGAPKETKKTTNITFTTELDVSAPIRDSNPEARVLNMNLTVHSEGYCIKR